MIPSCLNLQPDQIAKLVTWRRSLPKLTVDQHDEAFGGACMTSDVTFKVHSTSIGDEIKAECQGKTCCLSLDDGGKVIWRPEERGWTYPHALRNVNHAWQHEAFVCEAETARPGAFNPLRVTCPPEYCAVFNEPGDFDTYGLFVDLYDGARLVARSAKCPWEYKDHDPRNVRDWQPKDIVYSAKGEPYAYIHDKRHIGPQGII